MADKLSINHREIIICLLESDAGMTSISNDTIQSVSAVPLSWEN